MECKWCTGWAEAWFGHPLPKPISHPEFADPNICGGFQCYITINDKVPEHLILTPSTDRHATWTAVPYPSQLRR